MCSHLLLICWRFIVILGECIVPCNAIALLSSLYIYLLYIIPCNAIALVSSLYMSPLYIIVPCNDIALLYISPPISSISSWAACASLPIGVFSILSYLYPSLCAITLFIFSRKYLTITYHSSSLWPFTGSSELWSFRGESISNFTLCQRNTFGKFDLASQGRLQTSLHIVRPKLNCGSESAMYSPALVERGLRLTSWRRRSCRSETTLWDFLGNRSHQNLQVNKSPPRTLF